MIAKSFSQVVANKTIGRSWQVVPTLLLELLNVSNSAKAQRVMLAVLQLKKLDIATLRGAYDGD